MTKIISMTKTLAIMLMLLSLIAVSCVPAKRTPAPVRVDNYKSPADVAVSENTQLRDRLIQAIGELYLATPKDQQDVQLQSILTDRLPVVRLAGLRLAEQRINANLPVSAELRQQVRTLLSDVDAEVRREAALFIANAGDADGGGALLERLTVELTPMVREALLTSLGQLRDRRALSAVLESIDSKHNDVVAAAATALAKIVDKESLSPKQQKEMIDVLHDRYGKRRAKPESAGMREAIISALGVVGNESCLAMLGKALKDESASVRLASVNAISRLGVDKSERLLAPMSSDPDRGVRQAVIASLGAMAGQEHLQRILQRTDPAVEPDAAVRQHAWTVAIGVLAKADSKQLGEVLATLPVNDEDASRLIKILKLYVEVLKSEDSNYLPHAQRRLAAALIASGLPAESEPYLRDAYKGFSLAGSDEAAGVWDQWINVLLATDDISVVQVLSGQRNARAHARAAEKLIARLNALSAVGKWQATIMLSSETLRKQAVRLGLARREAITHLLEIASAEQAAADRKKVEALVGELVSTDESIRSKALESLQSMGERSVDPLLQELKKALSAETQNATVEKAIIEVLRQIAPNLTDFDLAAPKEQRLEQINKWQAARNL